MRAQRSPDRHVDHRTMKKSLHGHSPTSGSMKSLIAAVALAAFAQPAAALDIAACVIPKTRVLPSGNLERRFISVYIKPGGRPIYLKIAAPMSLYVVEENGAWLRLAGSPSSPFKEGEEIGWVKRSEVREQPMRNCNL